MAVVGQLIRSVLHSHAILRRCAPYYMHPAVILNCEILAGHSTRERERERERESWGPVGVLYRILASQPSPKSWHKSIVIGHHVPI